jgi:c-di-GMP-binding flagellar brake protein YcgR
MFEGTGSWWQRLTKRQPDAGSAEAATACEERRIWVRYPCDRPTQYAPDDEPPQSARVLDISRGGAKIIAGQGHEPGSLISIELPGPDGKVMCAALACVVYARQGDEDKWVLGCSFSKELEEAHLHAFAAGPGEAVSNDKRSWPRFTGNLTATVQLTNSYDLTRWPAKVLNLSAGGVALVVDRDIRNGTLLTVDLCGANGQRLDTILICVVHITTGEDGTRRLGCNFIRELEESDLRRLLG